MPLNASSVHKTGREARRILEQSRSQLADIIAVLPQEIVFTASATEANALALRGFPEKRVLVSAVEHPSALKAREDAETIPVDAQGMLRLDALDAMLTSDSRPALVSVMLANNETGAIQPMAEIAHIARRCGALLHTDAVQALGRIPLDTGLLDVDLLTLSSHKAGGPVGAAALVLRGNAAPKSLLSGGGQESGRRAGTENVAAIAGFALAAELSQDFAPQHRLRGWLDVMEAELTAFAPEVKVFSRDAKRLPNTSCLTMPGVSQEVQLMHFDLSGISLSAGSACTSGKIASSHVLAAMGASRQEASSAIRISGGWATEAEDVQAVANAWKSLYVRLKKAA